jgi:hypothetical protein
MPPSVTENMARTTDDRVLVQAAGAIGIPNLLQSWKKVVEF